MPGCHGYHTAGRVMDFNSHAQLRVSGVSSSHDVRLIDDDVLYHMTLVQISKVLIRVIASLRHIATAF